MLNRLDHPRRRGGAAGRRGASRFLGGEERKTLTAHFPRTVSLYEGSDVRVLGVAGRHRRLGDAVRHRRRREDLLRGDGEDPVRRQGRDHLAVGGRRPLRPAHPGVHRRRGAGQTAPTMDVEQTAVPLELDQIYDNLDKLNVALGPNGANRKGALSDLLEVTADNFGGQGEQFNQTIRDFSDFSQTLSDNRTEFFDSTRALQGFISTLAENDQTVRRVQRLDRRRLDRPGGREGGAGGGAAQPLGRARRGLDLRPRQPRRSSGATSRASTGWPGCWPSSATRSTRSSTAAPAGAQQPGADLQPAGRHARHPLQPRREHRHQLENDPAAFLCGLARPGRRPPAAPATRSRTCCPSRAPAGPAFGQGPAPGLAGALRPLASADWWRRADERAPYAPRRRARRRRRPRPQQLQPQRRRHVAPGRDRHRRRTRSWSRPSSATCSTWCRSRRSRSTTSASARSPTSRSTARRPWSPWSSRAPPTCPTTPSPRSARPACSARSSSS